MDTRLLKIFCTVAESGSLARAARTLHLTPSALSHGLKALETELGCRLFERAQKKLLLNQAGEQLLAHSKPILESLSAATDSMKRLGKWGQQRLRLGAAASACQHLLPLVIRDLKKAHPKLELQLDSGDLGGLIKLLHENKIDLALGVASTDSSGLESKPVFTDELMFVFSPAHPWAHSGHGLNKDEVRSQPFILCTESQATCLLIDEFFRKLDVVPKTIMEVASIEGVKEMVKLDLGVSILAPWTISAELNRSLLQTRPLGTQKLRRDWVVVSVAGRRCNLLEESLYRGCCARASALRLDRRDVPPLRSA